MCSPEPTAPALPLDADWGRCSVRLGTQRMPSPLTGEGLGGGERMASSPPSYGRGRGEGQVDTGGALAGPILPDTGVKTAIEQVLKQCARRAPRGVAPRRFMRGLWEGPSHEKGMNPP